MSKLERFDCGDCPYFNGCLNRCRRDPGAVTVIPSLGFTRGAIVRLDGTGPNMLVVRGLGEKTACILCESDDGGSLRLREFPTADLRQVLEPNQP